MFREDADHNLSLHELTAVILKEPVQVPCLCDLTRVITNKHLWRCHVCGTLPELVPMDTYQVPCICDLTRVITNGHQCWRHVCGTCLELLPMDTYAGLTNDHL